MNYNRIVLVGNLTRDPELSYTPSQTAVCNFGLAVNRKWKKSDGGEGSEVCFIDCTAWSKTAEVITKYLTKGAPVLVEGRLQQDNWETQDGTKRSKHKVLVDSFQFVPTPQHDPKEEEAGSWKKDEKEDIPF